MMSNTRPIRDAKERIQALNPKQSFIVQAPAGSGKTELLTQRFLCLLACVNKPEEVVAITFTKKAAKEMRTRILAALNAAKGGIPPVAAHQKTAYDLASKVLQRNKEKQWDLLSNPNRLSVYTIDALCYRLTMRMPLSSSFGARVALCDQPEKLYQRAARALLDQLHEDSVEADNIETLLLLLDNNHGKLEKLFMLLLAKRDQWLPLVLHCAQSNAIRHELETNLAFIRQNLLDQLEQTVNDHTKKELFTLMRFAATNLIQTKDDPVLSMILNSDQFPTTMPEKKDTWLAIIHMLLTKQGEWRRQANNAIGFPPASICKNAEQKTRLQDYKARYKTLLADLQQQPGLKKKMLAFRYGPNTHYSDIQWDHLAALFNVLPLLVAHLRLCFQETHQIDYIENSLAAINALGDQNNITDLSLALDHQISHLLVDEFQDTSLSQYTLLQRLTHEWQSPQRSLFFVGDPMQSIYRFRQAEVSLFIKAQTDGMGDIKLIPLQLKTNFRASAEMIEWLNQQFATIFPPTNSLSTGAIKYTPSFPNPALPTTDNQAVSLHSLIGESDDEARVVIDIVKAERSKHPTQTLAILVRSRDHLLHIIPQLQQASLSYQAVDIERLKHQACIQDLLALTRALLHSEDRIAWLAILRAPWCGLSLPDLHALANTNVEHSIWKTICDKQYSISSDGEKRLNHVRIAMALAFEQRYRLSLRDWVNQTWRQLKGDQCLRRAQDIEYIETFWQRLESLDQSYPFPEAEDIEESIDTLFANTTPLDDNPVILMTLHKAKGLEFDTVILPGLHKIARPSDKQLLAWMDTIHNNKTRTLIFAPIEENNSHDPIYSYIQAQEKEKINHELQRLLYVAATRSKSKLHLVTRVELKEEATEEYRKPHPGSLLHLLWPQNKDLWTNNPLCHTANINAQTKQKGVALGYRLDSSLLCSTHETDNLHVQNDKNQPLLDITHNIPSLFGTLVHHLLEDMSASKQKTWTDFQSKMSHYQKIAQYHGVPPQDINALLLKLEAAYHRICNDPRAQWLLSQKKAYSELALSSWKDNDTFKHVLDRVIIDDKDHCWIIDYKTTEWDPQQKPDMLSHLCEQHRPQLERYQHHLSQLESRPIHCALYFPLMSAWYEYTEISLKTFTDKA